MTLSLTTWSLGPFLTFERLLPLVSRELLDADWERKLWLARRNRVKTNTIIKDYSLGDFAIDGIDRRDWGCLSSDALSILRGNDGVPLEERLFDNKGNAPDVET